VRYSHRYRAYPDWTNTTSECEHHINTARQLYNHIRHDYQNSPDKNKPSEYDQNNQLPNWKDKWEVFGDLHSKVAQDVTSRFHQNLSNLSKKKQNGGKVGWLRHKCRGEYQSITYSQSGFELKNNNDRTGYRNLSLSKIGTIPIRYHRELPDTAVIKEVTLKKEASGMFSLRRASAKLFVASFSSVSLRISNRVFSAFCSGFCVGFHESIVIFI
jgi:putative transposase